MTELIQKHWNISEGLRLQCLCLVFGSFFLLSVTWHCLWLQILLENFSLCVEFLHKIQFLSPYPRQEFFWVLSIVCGLTLVSFMECQKSHIFMEWLIWIVENGGHWLFWQFLDFGLDWNQTLFWILWVQSLFIGVNLLSQTLNVFFFFHEYIAQRESICLTNRGLWVQILLYSFLKNVKKFKAHSSIGRVTVSKTVGRGSSPFVLVSADIAQLVRVLVFQTCCESSSLSIRFVQKKRERNGCLSTSEKDVSKRKAALFLKEKQISLRKQKRKKTWKGKPPFSRKKPTGKLKVIANEIGFLLKKKHKCQGTWIFSQRIFEFLSQVFTLLEKRTKEGKSPVKNKLKKKRNIFWSFLENFHFFKNLTFQIFWKRGNHPPK